MEPAYSKSEEAEEGMDAMHEEQMTGSEVEMKNLSQMTRDHPPGAYVVGPGPGCFHQLKDLEVVQSTQGEVRRSVDLFL